MGVRGYVSSLGERYMKGMCRFWAASFFSFFIFAAVLFQVLHVFWTNPRGEIFTEGLLQVLMALTTTFLFSVLLRIAGERFGRVGWRYEWVSLPVFFGFYFLWRALPMDHYFAMYAGGVLFILFTLSVYGLWTRNRQGLFPYLFMAFWKVLGETVLVGILGSLCLLSVNALLVSLFHGMWDLWLTFCYVLALQLFLSYLPEMEGDLAAPSLLFLLSRIVLPCYGVMLCILYLYMGKIAWAWEMPVGTMNWYASFAVFLYSLFYFCLHEEENPRLLRFLRYGAWALLPVMALQAWGIYIRFDAYGLTTARYLSMGCNFFGFCVVLFAIFRKSARFLFPLAAVLSLVLTLLPTNMIDVPAKNQWERMSEVLLSHDLVEGDRVKGPVEFSQEEKETLRSAYRYLVQDPGVWKYPWVIEMKEDGAWDTFMAVYEGETWIDVSFDWENMDISGYDKLYSFRVMKEGVSPDGTFTFDTADGKKTVPVWSYIERLRAAVPAGLDGTADEMTYDVNDRRRLYFRYVRVPKKGAHEGARLEGYLLEKSERK